MAEVKDKISEVHFENVSILGSDGRKLIKHTEITICFQFENIETYDTIITELKAVLDKYK